jgi:hypothetical protein
MQHEANAGKSDLHASAAVSRIDASRAKSAICHLLVLPRTRGGLRLVTGISCGAPALRLLGVISGAWRFSGDHV